MNLLKDKIPLSGTDEDSILKTISLILKNANVVRINVDAGTGMVDFWRYPSGEESEDIDVKNPFRARLKEVAMEEYAPEEGLTSHQQLFEMCEMLEDAGCYPVFILTGRTLSNLRKWIPFPRKSKRIAGIPIILEPDQMEDTLLVCGSSVRDAEPVDVSYVVKMTLP